jgi:hypothetical protein
LVVTAELTGDLLALDADDGAVLYRFDTGGAGAPRIRTRFRAHGTSP